MGPASTSVEACSILGVIRSLPGDFLRFGLRRSFLTLFTLVSGLHPLSFALVMRFQSVASEKYSANLWLMASAASSLERHEIFQNELLFGFNAVNNIP